MRSFLKGAGRFVNRSLRSRLGRGLMGVSPAGALLLLFAASLFAQPPPLQKQRQIASFEKVWTTIRDKHWQKNPGGLDWQAIHAEFYPRIENAKSADEMVAIIREMLGRLKQTHFGLFPAEVYNDVEDFGGDGSPGIE